MRARLRLCVSRRVLVVVPWLCLPQPSCHVTFPTSWRSSRAAPLAVAALRRRVELRVSRGWTRAHATPSVLRAPSSPLSHPTPTTPLCTRILSLTTQLRSPPTPPVIMDGEECVWPRAFASGWRRAAVVRRLSLQRSTHPPLCSTPLTPRLPQPCRLRGGAAHRHAGRCRRDRRLGRRRCRVCRCARRWRQEGEHSSSLPLVLSTSGISCPSLSHLVRAVHGAPRAALRHAAAASPAAPLRAGTVHVHDGAFHAQRSARKPEPRRWACIRARSGARRCEPRRTRPSVRSATHCGARSWRTARRARPGGWTSGRPGSSDAMAARREPAALFVKLAKLVDHRAATSDVK